MKNFVLIEKNKIERDGTIFPIIFLKVFREEEDRRRREEERRLKKEELKHKTNLESLKLDLEEERELAREKEEVLRADINAKQKKINSLNSGK